MGKPNTKTNGDTIVSLGQVQYYAINPSFDVSHVVQFNLAWLRQLHKKNTERVERRWYNPGFVRA